LVGSLAPYDRLAQTKLVNAGIQRFKRAIHGFFAFCCAELVPYPLCSILKISLNDDRHAACQIQTELQGTTVNAL
jgi:hypothetical protein